MLTLKSNSLHRKTLILVWIGELRNILEAGVVLWAALLSSRVALPAFGLDSLIELFGASAPFRVSRYPRNFDFPYDLFHLSALERRKTPVFLREACSLSSRVWQKTLVPVSDLAFCAKQLSGRRSTVCFGAFFFYR